MRVEEPARRVVESAGGDGPHIATQSRASRAELERRREFFELYRRCPIPESELLDNLGLFMNRQTLSRTVFLHDMYRRILDVHGVVMEFGVRWGRDLAAFASFRGMYEPYNYTRRIIGFDTFEGFPSVHPNDGSGDVVGEGDYGTTPDYESYLAQALDYHEAESPLGHIRKTYVVKGDARSTVPRYLEEHPETMIALAYFDLDLYEPTRDCLAAILPYVTEGTVLGFDELGFSEFPGETIAARELLDMRAMRFHRSPIAPSCSYLVFE